MEKRFIMAYMWMYGARYRAARMAWVKAVFNGNYRYIMNIIEQCEEWREERRA